MHFTFPVLIMFHIQYFFFITGICFREYWPKRNYCYKINEQKNSVVT